MTKLDFKVMYKQLYKAVRKPVIVDVPRLNFLMIDGKGDPEKGAEFRQAMEAMFSVAYTLKFSLKKAGHGIDYVVSCPEGLWWLPRGKKFSQRNKADWLWRLMIAQPGHITETLVAQAMKDVGKKKDLPALKKLRLEEFAEGRCVQVLHVGPYSEEGPTIAAMEEFAKAEGYTLAGKHHEIYLSDPRRTAPEKLKTIIRHPLERVAVR